VLRQKRRDSGTTLKELANKVGLTLQALSMYERGGARPSEAAMTKWVRAVGDSEDVVDEWIDRRVEDEVAEVLARLRGRHAVPLLGIQNARYAVRAMLAERRRHIALRVVKK